MFVCAWTLTSEAEVHSCAGKSVAKVVGATSREAELSSLCFACPSIR